MRKLVPGTVMLGLFFLLTGCGSGEEGCKPDCDGKECGPDGCGGTCPPGCGAGESCRDGVCQTVMADLTWVQINGDTFDMGSDTGETDENPVHQVTVPSFEMMKDEVTVLLYSQCVDNSACTAPNTGESRPPDLPPISG